eukprot:6200170-Pleurochrysis_carterae.AAC.2
MASCERMALTDYFDTVSKRVTVTGDKRPSAPTSQKMSARSDWTRGRTSSGTCKRTRATEPSS